ncbi:MAG: hypothetical protein J6A52_01935 [Bacilli bacterium]|nr:hypothetical protein [Bacilli bacterium]
MKKKIFLSLFILLALFTITGCGGNKSNDSGNVKDVQDVKQNEGNDTKTLSKANITETVILDKGGIKVTAKSISYDNWSGPEIKVLIENNSSENVTIQARKFSINGIMMDPTFSAEVNAGKKANDTISIFSSDLEAAQITTIKDIEFGLDVFNSDSWNDIFKQEGIKLETNAKDYVQKYNTDGKLVVDQNNIKIYVLKKDDKDSFWGADIYVYIENNSSQDITVQARDVSIDGFMIDPTFSSDVSAGKKAYDTITFHESDLKDNDITDIKEIELKFDVFNADSWNDIFKTDTKKISF